MSVAHRPDRRTFLLRDLTPLSLAILATGCRAMPLPRMAIPGGVAMIGGHEAGLDTFTPLVHDAVATLLARHVDAAVQPVPSEGGDTASRVRHICFLGVENRSPEDIGDLRERIDRSIESRILESTVFQPVDRRCIDAGLRDTRMSPDQLLEPEQMRSFAAHMAQQGRTIDFLLYATLTSGATRDNRAGYHDQVLTLELVEVATGVHDEQSAKLGKS